MRMSERDAFDLLGLEGYLVSPAELDRAYRRALDDPKKLGSIQLISKAYELLVEDEAEEVLRIYVVCSASYRQCHLHGRWLDPRQAPEVMEGQIAQMIAESPTAFAQEWEIHRTEGFGYKGTFQDSLETLHDKAAFITQHGVLGIKLLEHYKDVQRAHYIWEEHDHGIYESRSDFARALFRDAYTDSLFMDHRTNRRSLITQLNCHIDYEALGRSLFERDYYGIRVEDGIHVFRDL